ncbi:lignin-forming anionic peroxidase-like [Mercurialis annua]|uniref:lignin-forming anionic peroxidase-like n=1 Tax=Mercurialis annua TaxID=3986 RepID=UPI00215F134D|nr:lignin-forming anionic peroxidase-like [Mercurialis annua]
MKMVHNYLSYAYMIFTIFLIIFSSLQCQAQLSPEFYDKTCPNASNCIRTAIRDAVSRDRRIAASLMRLHFHDCFVQGCDGSILLDDTPSMSSEKFARNNNNSLRGYDVINNAKAQVESICPGVVSCADILTLAVRDASVAMGGPSWTVKLGRRDSTSANRSLADAILPGASASLESLISLFGSKGLSARDMVALSGSHTIGQARCVTFSGRIYNNASTDIDPGFATIRRRQCPPPGNVDGSGNLVPLDLVTPNSFDNNYFKNLLQKKGLLQSDQVLFNGGSTDNIVSEYSRNPSIFISDFASAMVKMADIEPLTGSQGQIRRVCNLVN